MAAMKAALVITEEVDGKKIDRVVETVSSYAYSSNPGEAEQEKAKLAFSLWVTHMQSLMSSKNYRIIFS